MKVSPEENQLALRLAKQIETSGPISVAEYMRLANEEYYARSDPLGVDGDFITAPEISQMFGELVGLWLADIWLRHIHPPDCHYVELGPGRGTLAADVLRSMARFELQPQVHFVETSEALRAKQREAVAGANFLTDVDGLPENGPLFIVANEFFDALPIRQMVATHAGWRERMVVRDRGAKFLEMPGSYSMDNLIPDDLKNAPTHSIYELSPDTSNIIYTLANRLKTQGGALLIIDYGYTSAGHGSTLQAVSGHQFANPFEEPGTRDLTAHVNFREISNLARMHDLRVSGPVDQGAWLSALGINQRAKNLADASPDRADEIYAARDRLIHEDEMGCLFKIVAITAPDWPEPDGFS